MNCTLEEVLHFFDDRNGLALHFPEDTFCGLLHLFEDKAVSVAKKGAKRSLSKKLLSSDLLYMKK